MSAARAYLFSLEQIGIKLGLEQIRALLESLEHPERAYPSVLVAGTNGKGSVAAMVERGLRAAGRRTGRYTSPHLSYLEERFAVDGVSLTAGAVDRAAGRVRTASGRLPAPPSFFEATTALALDAFRDARVDVAVLEVGLGGRLDATNAVTPVAVAITLVDLDHEAWLGSTHEAIAREKAGVIKPGSLVVLGDNRPDVEAVVRHAAAVAGAPLVLAREAALASTTMVDGYARLQIDTARHRYDDVRLSLAGRHQVANALVALCLLEALDAGGHGRVPPAAIRTALEDVVWPGRLERLELAGTPVLLDGAHNPSGAVALADFVRETYDRRLPIVLGVMRDKQAAGILEALAPVAERFVFTAPRHDRAASPASLAALAARVTPAVPVETTPVPAEAVARARAGGVPVVVAGSLFLVGEIRAEIS